MNNPDFSLVHGRYSWALQHPAGFALEAGVSYRPGRCLARQVLAFLYAQISDIRFDGGQSGLVELSVQVARHALSVKSLLEDRGTRSAMEQYIAYDSRWKSTAPCRHPPLWETM